MNLLLVTVDPDVVSPFMDGGLCVREMTVRCSPSFLTGPWDLVVLPVAEFLLRRASSETFPATLRWMPYGPSHLLRTAWSRGAWDYMKSPWDIDELEARASRLLSDVLEWKTPSLVFRLRGVILSQGNQQIILGTDEATFLQTLLERPGIPVAPDLLEQTLWKARRRPGSRALAMVASRLRRKIRLLGWADGDPIPVQRNLGYRLP